MRQNEQLLLLKRELEWMNNAAEILSYSENICHKIGVKDNYSFDELDSFEALTSRFARLSDIIIQKTLRLIDIIELETQGSIRDRINRAEKKELITSANDFIDIRNLRNAIAHEYLPEHISQIFKEVLLRTPILLDTVKRINLYCEKYRSL